MFILFTGFVYHTYGYVNHTVLFFNAADVPCSFSTSTSFYSHFWFRPTWSRHRRKGSTLAPQSCVRVSYLSACTNLGSSYRDHRYYSSALLLLSKLSLLSLSYSLPHSNKFIVMLFYLLFMWGKICVIRASSLPQSPSYTDRINYTSEPHTPEPRMTRVWSKKRWHFLPA